MEECEVDGLADVGGHLLALPLCRLWLWTACMGQVSGPLGHALLLRAVRVRQTLADYFPFMYNTTGRATIRRLESNVHKDSFIPPLQ